MIEVTQSNFSYVFPQVAFAIENSDFISIDTEFSGLFLNDQVKPSLFDTSDDRYEKLRKSVDQFCLLQVGITIFKRNLDENQYDASTYNFYLCPVSFCSLNPTLSFQASALEFLNKHNFDYDKCFKDGISYMNNEQEQQVIEDLGKDYQAHDTDSQNYEEQIQSLCSLVASWICKKSENFLTLPLEEVPASSVFLVHNELRRRFCQIWTSTNQFNQIVVEKLSSEKRKFLEEENKKNEESQKNEQLVHALGFTKVFRLLDHFKKPIIGHNMLMDLLFLYDKCHKPLPASFSTFKQEIHKIFPLIFDTKHLQHSLRQEFEILKTSRIRRLDDLYILLNSQKALGLTLLNPTIHMIAAENTTEEDSTQYAPHHAGYDAFQCGCVFIRLCHLFKTRGHMETAAVPMNTYIHSLKDYANCVNVIRATISHIKLDGEEPQSERPPLLHVSVVSSKELFTLNQLSLWFSVYGTVDIRMIDSTQAIVATSSYMVARDILYSFKKHPAIRVTRYKFWQHSKYGKLIWWSSVVVASGSCMLLLYDVLRK